MEFRASFVYFFSFPQSICPRKRAYDFYKDSTNHGQNIAKVLLQGQCCWKENCLLCSVGHFISRILKNKNTNRNKTQPDKCWSIQLALQISCQKIEYFVSHRVGTLTVVPIFYCNLCPERQFLKQKLIWLWHFFGPLCCLSA